MDLTLKHHLFLITLLSLCLTPTCSTETCATLKFPTLNDSLGFTAAENKRIALPFILSNVTCDRYEKFEVSVWGQSDQSDIPIRLCKVPIIGGKCLDFTSSVCTCEENGRFAFYKTVLRSDSGTWTWRSDMFATKTVSVNITYPAEVNDLKFVPPTSEPSSALEPGRRLNISCTWDRGNPPVQAQLIHSRLMSLTTETVTVSVDETPTVGSLTTTTYTFDNIQCTNAGFIHCVAPGASHNKTETLLVKCPPSILQDQNPEFNVTGDSVNVSFAIRTHTAHIDTCHLTHLKSGQSGNTKDCLRSLSVTGTLPDLLLTVRLDNVTSEDEGRWNLSVSNNAGSGYMEIWLTVPDTDKSSSGTAETTTAFIKDQIEQNPQKHPESTGIIIGAVILVASILVCAVGAGIYTARKRKRNERRRLLATQRAQIENNGRRPGLPANGNQPDDDPRQMLIAQQQQHARQRKDLAPGHIVDPGVKGAAEASGNAGREPADGSETYVNISTVKKNKGQNLAAALKTDEDPVAGCSSQQDVYVDVKDIQKRKRKAKQDGATNAVSEDLDKDTTAENKTEEGLMYVQLDFRGRKPRNLTIQPLPRTDYAEVNFQADPAPSLDDE